MLLINVADGAEDDLTHQPLHGYFRRMGRPPSPNILILLLNQRSIGPESILRKGRMEAVAEAMTESALAAVVTIRQHARVTRILTEGTRATRVEQSTGENLTATKIGSALHPTDTLRDLIGPHALDAGL